MNPLALVLVILGLLVAISRAPLIVAPDRTRSYYLSLMQTDGRMRSLSILIILLGAAMLWGSSSETGSVATIVYWFGLLMFAIAAFFILLPGQARRLGTKAWESFSIPVLRGLGLLAVIGGLAIAAYGLSL